MVAQCAIMVETMHNHGCNAPYTRHIHACTVHIHSRMHNEQSRLHNTHSCTIIHPCKYSNAEFLLHNSHSWLRKMHIHSRMHNAQPWVTAITSLKRGLFYTKITHHSYTEQCQKKLSKFRDRTRNVEEDAIFRVVSRFPRYISCCISENRLPHSVSCVVKFNIPRKGLMVLFPLSLLWKGATIPTVLFFWRNTQ